jgi:hypothetical protein
MSILAIEADRNLVEALSVGLRERRLGPREAA